MGVDQNLQLSTGYLQGLSVLTDAYTRHTHAYQAYRGVVLGWGHIIGPDTIFSNIFENIEGPAHFHIREYSREYRCPGRLFPQEYTSFPQPLTLVDLESKDILEYS